MNLLKLEKYGKVNFLKRTILEFKGRFRVNPLTENILNEQGINCYIPRLNKFRFALGLIGVLFCIVTPVITPLLIIPLLWSLK